MRLTCYLDPDSVVIHFVEVVEQQKHEVIGIVSHRDAAQTGNNKLSKDDGHGRQAHSDFLPAAARQLATSTSTRSMAIELAVERW